VFGDVGGQLVGDLAAELESAKLPVLGVVLDQEAAAGGVELRVQGHAARLTVRPVLDGCWTGIGWIRITVLIRVLELRFNPDRACLRYPWQRRQ
jgi:hypothetical protein